ncbi:ISL3 family transposase [Candidatus Mycobacterium methanotrophicum]|uniref:ISL3 family transposase n=3 Tax=Candidatus Mycobacterium methanotrophicum TaxID=2943498 RepID=A0ABY4QH39_9MYCO|nr:ISL3 family transposase [Candidatus Mycobacterium methanotrophicum]UQX09537.1 ISL3 family transposase [Candidatus Mycobacterium methanotrophicum]UQX10325.1 ISL3 family transposase [Candidatus Mycobacterium methanotrophicum]UQX10328.1 ISL3 family transposase [Candidatus Mycobacterium methanotrophicum]UQX10334.1 ISL3 family transposase [Candidatus Mycobacterium methanotrophicum]UQX10664.1 ISL3 family transposase [Candidatus Mycobacterium methanotrophicum]
MRKSRVFATVLGGQDMVIDDVMIETETSRGKRPVTSEALVFAVRPKANQASRCSRCQKRCPGYDGGDAIRRWRSLDLGTTKAYLQAAAPRVACPEHGVVVAHVPWARPGARHTWAFEDTAAWLSAHAAISVVAVFLRVAWRTIAAIVGRVVADGRDTNDLLVGLTRIGIDEIAYRKGHRYLTCVIDHTTGRLVWAAEGRNKDTLGRFFDQLGAERAAALTHVSCDGAEWIHAVLRDRAPAAVICLDPFHVVAWALKALDKVRVRTMARAGVRDRHAMWAVRKNPADLTGEQRTSLAAITATNATLYRAYLLKEQLREVFRVKGRDGRRLLAGWLSWASHSRIPEFVAVARTVRRHKELIGNTLDHQLSNARSEATNTHLRALTKRAYGFHSPEALIGMAMLTRGGLCPALPGRAA